MAKRMRIGIPLATQEEIDNWSPPPCPFTQLIIYHYTCCRKQTRATREGLLIPDLIDFCHLDLAGEGAILSMPTLTRFITTPCDDCTEIELAKELENLKVRVHAWMDKVEAVHLFSGGGWGANHLDPDKHANKRIKIMAPSDASNTGTDNKEVTATPEGV